MQVRPKGQEAHLHGAHVKAPQEELDRDDQVNHGAVHVCRGAAVPGEHGQEVGLLLTGAIVQCPEAGEQASGRHVSVQYPAS